MSCQSRTVAEVVDWYLKNDVQMASAPARKERERLLRLFCLFTNSEGRRIGKSRVDQCRGSDLVEFLNSHWRRRGQMSQRRQLLCGLLRDWRPSAWAFTNHFGGQWSTRALTKTIVALRKKLGLPVDLRLYSCRHGFATQAIVNGLDVATLAVLMGHKSIMTTQRYLHVADKRAHLNAAVEKAVKFGDSEGSAQTEAQLLIALLKANLQQNEAARKTSNGKENAA